VIGVADGTSISTEKDDADPLRRIDQYTPTLLPGVATMNADVTRPSLRE
jgi:hypothetical protein